METLIPLLEEFADVDSASDVRNIVLRGLDMFFTFFRLRRKVDTVVIDVFSSLAFLYAVAFSSLCFFLRKPYVLVLRGGKLPSRFNTSKVVFTWILKHSERTVAPSSYLAHFFREAGFTITIIPNFIELSHYPFLLRRNLALTILNIRGFGKPYNPLMSLKAVKELVNRGYTPNLTMLGNPDEYYYSDVLKYISSHRLQPYVSIYPKMPKEKWVAMSADFDIMLSNPVIDNTPVSIIEGLALGMVVVSTKVGGVPYLCSNDEVVFVENGNSDQLVETLISLSEDSSKVEDLSRGGRQFAENFSWDAVAPQWKSLFDSIHE